MASYNLIALTTLLLQVHVGLFSTAPRPTITRGVLSKAVDFNYDVFSPKGPPNWKNSFPQCGSTAQSPIDIKMSTVYGGSGNAIFYNDVKKMEGELLNNGDMPVFYVKSRTKILDGVPGSPEEGFYYLDNFHIHFGSTYDFESGSEHSVNSKKYAAEIHLEHYSSAYPSYEAAAGHIGGTVTVAVLADINYDRGYNSYLDLFILRAVSHILYPAHKGYNTSLYLSDILPKSGSFYNYVGSSAVPPCKPNNMWLVMERPIELSPAAMYTLYMLRDLDGKPISEHGNQRPIQPTGAMRRVESNFYIKLHL